MAQKKTLKQKIWYWMRSFYWRYISTIDDPYRYCMIEHFRGYWPSFFKIHSPEEAEEIIARNHEILMEQLEEFGKWEDSWRAEEARMAEEAKLMEESKLTEEIKQTEEIESMKQSN